ncbi:hydrogen gas-evolving membrane-bound hydrogenase subunit E [Cellulomonas iranensis]|uniref:Multicomponent Na+:H+ antiporter subunit A n=1 Tax=Cellulomonas iranensis TaxID=76862 RepID=A0ABU0GJU6_9CELL|nr:hydrogen gas-evolving membrane-bound hydrogenase subunit E [Cellulomonas iranensis]MDQ0425641.1 multicomponent Na+:H+ antiporter subunit A [Cellulomonas iranensis]
MSLVALVAGAWALVAVTPALARLIGPRAGWVVAAGLTALAVALVQLRTSAGDVTESVAWIPAVDVALRLRLDGLGFLFAMLVLLVGAVVMVYSTGYVRSPRPVGFFVLMTAFAAAMLTLVLADDLVVLFVAWELTTLCSYLLILVSGPTAGPPATRTLLVTALGGLALLGAVALVVVRTGTTELTAALASPVWGDDPAFAGAVAVLVVLAAMTKSAQLPFHAWLPDAMVAPAPVSAYLHAAAMVKAGIYLLLVLAPAASASPLWSGTLVVVGVTTAVMGAVFALQRTDLKELLAYSTVSQLGLLVAVIGVGTPGALLAACVHVVAHALFKSAAFMTVGVVEKRTGTRDLRELHGLARAMPWTAAMLVLAVVSMAGVAPALGFVSKELVLDAFVTAEQGAVLGWGAVAVVTVGAALTVAYSLRMVVTTLPGLAPTPPVRRADPAMTAAITVTALGGLAVGLVPGTLDALVAPAAAVVGGIDVDQVPYLTLWHGVTPALLLSVAAVLGGVGLTLVRRRVDALLVGRRLFPADGTAVVQRVVDGIIAGGRRVGDLTRSDVPATHLAVPVLLVGASTLGLTRLWSGLPDVGPVTVGEIALLVGVAAGVVGVVRARQRLTAVIATGVAGFGVVLWFVVLGASDVAMTQLLVEILTVVVMVLVLRRMSGTFRPVRARRQVVTAVVALAAGAAATVATVTLTGHRPLSGAGEFYLRRAEDLTGGTNVVNTILVDFRALDTLGELVVLAVGAVAITALLDARRAVDRRSVPLARTPLVPAAPNAVFLGVLDRYLVPLMIVGSVLLLLRGHDAPGGGFIAALLGAAALVLAYLSAATDEVPRVERPYLSIAGWGVVVAVGTGLLGLAEGSFLRPLHLDVLGLKVTTALVFDVGVYLAVLGVLLAAVVRLGLSPASDRRADARRARTARDAAAPATRTPAEQSGAPR